MRPSEEIQALYVQCCEAMSNGDVSFFRSRFSKKEGVMAIGTDPAEWWVGYTTIISIFEAQLKEMDDIQVLPDRPMAFCNGSAGWAAGRPTVILPDGRKKSFRLTLVFQKDGNEWKIVQWHFSTGVSNEELLGDALTTG